MEIDESVRHKNIIKIT